MRRYPKYKDSGIEWLGEIPEGWKLKKLKYLVRLINEKIEDKNGHEFQIALENIESFTGKLIGGNGSFEGIGNSFKKGDVLFNKLRPYLAKAVLAHQDGIAVGELLIFRPIKDLIDNNFLFYKVLSKNFISEVNSSTYGTKMPRASWEFIGNLKLVVPPLVSQKSIGIYLNQTTDKIDKFITKKQTHIDLLKEYRTAIINEAVTKGLNPNVKMKDSGIEWIGEIPEHWKSINLKYISKIKYGLGQPPRQMEGGLPLIRATNIKRGKIVEKDLICVDPEDIPYDRDPVLKTNDIIVVRSGAYTADSAIVTEKHNGSIIGYDLLVKSDSVNPKLIAFSLLSDYVLTNQLLLKKLRAAQPHLNVEELGETIMVIPPNNLEQIELAEYIESETTKIDKSIFNINNQIILLKQYRTSLISEVVTGKVDVRDIDVRDEVAKCHPDPI